MLPERQIVHLHGMSYFCVKTYKYGCWGWPVVNKAGRCYDLDRNITKLEALFVFEDTDVQAQHIRLDSPIAVILGTKKKTPGCDIVATSGPLELTQYHIERAFSGLSEFVLRCIYKDHGLDEPALADTEEVIPSLQVDLLVHFVKDLGEEKALSMVLRAAAEVTGLDEEAEAPTLEQLRDTVQIQEQSKITDAQVTAKKKKQTDADRRTSLQQRFIESKTRISPGWKLPMKPKKVTVAAAKKAAARVYADLDKSVDDFLRLHKPPLGAVWTDHKNGRWRISYDKLVSRSMSWTKMNDKVAACVSIRQFWDWALEYDALRTPDHIEKILADAGI